MKKVLAGLIMVLSLVILFDIVIRPVFDPAGSRGYSYAEHLGCKLFSPQREYQKMGSAGATTDLVNSGYWCKSDDEVRQWIKDHAG